MAHRWIDDDFDRETYLEFWEEYERLLADAVAASER